MSGESHGTLELREAAAPTREEITRQAAGKPPRIAAMLLYIRDHLFEPELSVARVKEQCQLRDNSIALHFHSTLGVPPGTFITECRLAVAERLLAGTWLPIWRITELLGYSSIQVFSRAYHRRKGQRPSAFRRQAEHEPGPRPTAPAAPKIRESDLLERALAGQLESTEAADLIRRLLEIYPPQLRSF